MCSEAHRHRVHLEGPDHVNHLPRRALSGSAQCRRASSTWPWTFRLLCRCSLPQLATGALRLSPTRHAGRSAPQCSQHVAPAGAGPHHHEVGHHDEPLGLADSLQDVVADVVAKRPVPRNLPPPAADAAQRGATCAAGRAVPGVITNSTMAPAQHSQRDALSPAHHLP